MGVPGSAAPFLRVLAMKRDIRLAVHDVRELAVRSIAQGRMGIVLKDGMKIFLSNAQPAQLEFILQRHKAPADRCVVGLGLGVALGGTSGDNDASRPVATPAKCRRTALREEQPQILRSEDAPAVAEVAELASSINSLPEFLLDHVMSFQASARAALVQLSETCTFLESFAARRQSILRLGHSRGFLEVEAVATKIVRRSCLSTLDLSGLVNLNAAGVNTIASALAQTEAVLRSLSLRGCKAVTDVALQNLLKAVPRLESLDLLDVPRISNRSLQVPLASLHVLAVGSLARPGQGSGASATGMYRSDSTLSGFGVSGGTISGRPGAPAKVKVSPALFTAQVLMNLGHPPPSTTPRGRAPEPASTEPTSAPPLTHAVILHCAGVEVFPYVAPTLQHLDLRRASIQMADEALSCWRPLASCPRLHTLCIAGNSLLSAGSINVLIASLPAPQLQVLDVSETLVGKGLLRTLAEKQGTLTHLRVAGCPSMTDETFTALFFGLPVLEVFDVAMCRALESFPEALAQPLGAAPAPQHGSSVSKKFRLLGVGQTAYGEGSRLMLTRAKLDKLAPGAHAVPGSLDIFGSYATLPPTMM